MICRRLALLIAGFSIFAGLAPAVAQERRAGSGRMTPTVEGVLATDPLLVDFEKLGPLIEQRSQELKQAENEKASLRRRGGLLREIGALQWLRAEIRRSSPDGGIREQTDSEASFRRATEILARVGDGAALDLIDVQLRLATVIAASRCEGGVDCGEPAVEAAVFADEALKSARRIGDPEWTARALRVNSRVRSGLKTRSVEVTGVGKGLEAVQTMGDCYQQMGLDCKAQVGEQPDDSAPVERQMAWTVAFSQCLATKNMNGCSGAAPPDPEAEEVDKTSSRDDEQELLTEALRLEPAGASWSAGRIETLLLLAGIQFRNHQRQQAVPLLQEAATGFRMLGLEGDSRFAGTLTRYYLATRSQDALPLDPYFDGQRVADLLTGRSTGNEDLDLVLLWRSWTTTSNEKVAFQLATLLLRQDRADAVERIVERALGTYHLAKEDEQRLRRLGDQAAQRLKGGGGGDPSDARPTFAILPEGAVELDRPPFYPPPSGSQRKPASCNASDLRSRLSDLLAAEKDRVVRSLRKQSEASLFGSMLEITDRAEVFLPVLDCKTEDPESLRTSVERVLLRSQLWRHRSALLNTAWESRSPERLRDADRLIALRNLRSQLRLRTTEDLRQQLAQEPLPRNLDWPDWAEPVQTAIADLEYSISQAETELAARLAGKAAGAEDITDLWSPLLKGLGADGALVGYVPVGISPQERRLVGFVVTGDGAISWADLGDEKTVAQGLAGTTIADRSGDLRKELRQAGADLFDPLERHLQGKRRVLLVASGAARFLPWSALEDSTGHYLGERFTVQWLEWIGDAAPWNKMDEASDPGEVVLVTPSYPSAPERPSWRNLPSSFSALPGALQELATVSAILGGSGRSVREISGPEATEEALRGLHGPSLVHIAAHGFRRSEWLSSERWLFSPWFREAVSESSLQRVGIALSGSNRKGSLAEDDGLLTAGEAANLDLRGTSLVVLSGCETGLPALQASGVAYDLSLGFRMAGAQSVVASLWRTDDRATQHLMSELYRRLQEGEPVAEALWQAKQKVRQEPGFDDPRFWAAFEVFGRNVALPNPGTR